MLKFSSLAATIAMGEMLNAAQRIYFINGAVIELLFVCAVWYLAGTTVLSIGQYYLERHFGRDAATATSERRWFWAWARRPASTGEA
ncbi:hypothetical protein D3C80_1993850 [compost metagenome]